MIFTIFRESGKELLTTISGSSAVATEFEGTFTPLMLDNWLIADVAYDEPKSSFASAILAWISVLVIEVAMIPRFS